MDGTAQHQSTLQNKRTEVDMISRYSDKILQLSKQFKEKYKILLAKLLAKLDGLIKELVHLPMRNYLQDSVHNEQLSSIQLSVHAQYLITECITGILF